MIFNKGIITIRPNLGRTFDITRPCLILGKVGDNFDICEELQDQAAIQKSYIQLYGTHQKIKGMAASQGCNRNLLRVYNLSYVTSVYQLQLSSNHDLAAINLLDKLEGLLAKSVKFANRTDNKVNF